MDDGSCPCLYCHAGLWRSATEKSGCAPSKAHPDDGLVDEVVLTCSEENKEELSEIYVVFSPNFYAKVGSKRGQQQLTEDLVLPSSLDYHSFNKWLIKYQQKDDAMQIKRIPLQIKKN